MKILFKLFLTSSVDSRSLKHNEWGKKFCPNTFCLQDIHFLDSSWKPTPLMSRVSGGVQSQAYLVSPGQWGICRAGVSHSNLAAREFFPISAFTSMEEIKVDPVFILWWMHFWKPLGFEEFPFILSMTALGRICREQDPGNTHPCFLCSSLTISTSPVEGSDSSSSFFTAALPSQVEISRLDLGLTAPKGLLDTPAPLWAFRYLI